jgi:hypothetical protein
LNHRLQLNTIHRQRLLSIWVMYQLLNWIAEMLGTIVTLRLKTNSMRLPLGQNLANPIAQPNFRIHVPLPKTKWPLTSHLTIKLLTDTKIHHHLNAKPVTSPIHTLRLNNLNSQIIQMLNPSLISLSICSNNTVEIMKGRRLKKRTGMKSRIIQFVRVL